MPLRDRLVNAEIRSASQEKAAGQPSIEPPGPGCLSQHVAQAGLSPTVSGSERVSNLCLSIGGTEEFVKVRPWRNRAEILEILNISSGPGATRLLDDLSRRFADQGGQLILVYHTLFSSNEALFRHAGFVLLEEIIEMASAGPALFEHRPDPAIRFRREYDPATLLGIDREAFTWLWRNSEDEMTIYLRQEGLRAFAASGNRDQAGYITYTMHRGFAHIDRMAVLPAEQGRGLGKAMMSWTLGTIREAGGENVILTTQRTNTISQNLYMRFGFTETGRGYSIFGKWL